ncbi:hypothetical protein HWV62_43698 [Athelia sp. TMB]|nr:hypothetical protein HWV62_43698 [Athelia sp. TMB]
MARGYLGVGAVDDKRWNTADSIIDTVMGGYVLRSQIATWREAQASALRRHIDLLVAELALEREGVPVPDNLDYSILRVLVSSKAAMLRAMAATRYHFMDLVAFYRWAREAFDEELTYRQWDEFQPPLPVWKAWWNLPTVGYLVDLREHQHTHNLPMWVFHRVPVHYPWDKGLLRNLRYRLWNLAVLRAEGERTYGGEPPIYAIRELVQADTFEVYDEWMQDRSPHLAEGFLDEGGLDPEGGHACYVEDFEGWHLRPTTMEENSTLMDQLFYFRDDRRVTPSSHTYFRWIERGNDTLEILITQTNEPHRQSLGLLRELYKFRNAPAMSRSTVPTSLLDQMGDRPEGGSIVVDLSSPRSQQRELDFTRNRSARNRSTSPPSSGVNSARTDSSAWIISKERTLAHIIAFRGSSYRSGGTSPITERLQSGRAAVAALVLFEDSSFPDGFVQGGRWSRKILEKAILHFPSANAQWRLRAWLLDEPNLPVTELLDRALSYFIPFYLEIPSAVVHQFTRPLESYDRWEHSAGEFYREDRPDQTIMYQINGAKYATAYKMSVLNQLNKPNAHAFLYEGGLLARIVYHFGGEELLSRAKKGLSAAVTLHGAATTSIERTTKRESVSTAEKLILLGQSNPGGPKTELDTDKPAAKTDGDWGKDVRAARRTTRLDDKTWELASKELLAQQGDSWEGRPIASIFSLVAQGNTFAED